MKLCNALEQLYNQLYIGKSFEHFYIILITIIIAILIGIPLGIISYFKPNLRHSIITTIDVIQTIPALALLGIIMVFTGAGKLTTIIGLTFYSLLPIVNNTYTGLDNISPAIIEAARGVGMNKIQRLTKVMLPLSFPMIISGIKIAVVTAVGTAVFAFYVGGGGLGSVITGGIRIQNMELIIKGMGAIMLMALAFDKFISVFEKKLQDKYKVNNNR